VRISQSVPRNSFLRRRILREVAVGCSSLKLQDKNLTLVKQLKLSVIYFADGQIVKAFYLWSQQQLPSTALNGHNRTTDSKQA